MARSAQLATLARPSVRCAAAVDIAVAEGDADRMPAYIATIKARFPASVEDSLDDFRKRLADRHAFELEGYAPVQNGDKVWLPVSIDIEASTASKACIDALRQYEDDARATIGMFDAVDLGVEPPERGTIQRKYFGQAPPRT